MQNDRPRIEPITQFDCATSLPMSVFDWKVEFDYLVITLCEKLDLAKQKGYLHYSLDAHHAATGLDPVHRHYVLYGKAHFVSGLGELCRTVSVFSTSPLSSHLLACCLDHVTLSHVANLIRLEELLERNVVDPTPDAKATALCAMVGELTAVKRMFLESRKSNFEKTKASKYRYAAEDESEEEE
eukprot:Selendium_serpulae@DN7892_c0_g1_i1.p1